MSVVMSCYNGERWLKDSVESVLAQSFGDFEFIVVNDGSSDQTLEILHWYAAMDSRIVLLDKERTELADSLNYGLRIARGQLIARLDADDLCASQRLEVQFGYMSTHPETVLLGSGFTEIDETGRVRKQHYYPADHGRLVRRLQYGGGFFPHSSTCYKRSVVLQLEGYRPRIRRAQDRDLWLRLAERGQLGCIHTPLVQIRKHPEQVSYEDNGRRQLLDSHAAAVSYFIRQRGERDPIASDEEETARRFFDWVRQRLDQKGVFETRRAWTDARSAFFVEQKRLNGLLYFASKLLKSGHAYRLVREKLFGSKLSEHLASEWLERCAAS